MAQDKKSVIEVGFGTGVELERGQRSLLPVHVRLFHYSISNDTAPRNHSDTKDDGVISGQG